MEPRDYTVKHISGEYATLIDENGDELFIALSLLPEGTDEGSRLHYEAFSYELL